MRRLIVTALLVGFAATALAQGVADTPLYDGRSAADWSAQLPSEDVAERQEVRREAATLMWRHGPLAVRAVPALTAALESGDAVVRANAAGALGNVGDAARPALDALLHVAARDDAAARRWAALGGAGRARPRRSWTPCARSRSTIARLGSDPAPYQELSVVERLGPRAAGAVPTLVRLIDAEDLSVRFGAIGTLPKMGAAAKDAIPALEAATGDANSDVAEAAGTALDLVRAED